MGAGPTGPKAPLLVLNVRSKAKPKSKLSHVGGVFWAPKLFQQAFSWPLLPLQHGMLIRENMSILLFEATQLKWLHQRLTTSRILVSSSNGWTYTMSCPFRSAMTRSLLQRLLSLLKKPTGFAHQVQHMFETWFSTCYQRIAQFSGPLVSNIVLKRVRHPKKRTQTRISQRDAQFASVCSQAVDQPKPCQIKHNHCFLQGPLNYTFGPVKQSPLAAD